jgi:uncharacterized protein DUF1206
MATRPCDGTARRASDSPPARALARAGGIDKALLTLRNQPFGEVLLILAALGLIVFGIYGLCEPAGGRSSPAELPAVLPPLGYGAGWPGPAPAREDTARGPGARCWGDAW